MRLLGVLGPPLALIDRQQTLWVYFVLELVEKCRPGVRGSLSWGVAAVHDERANAPAQTHLCRINFVTDDDGGFVRHKNARLSSIPSTARVVNELPENKARVAVQINFVRLMLNRMDTLASGTTLVNRAFVFFPSTVPKFGSWRASRHLLPLSDAFLHPPRERLQPVSRRCLSVRIPGI